MRTLALFAALLPCIVSCGRRGSDEAQLRRAFSGMKAAALEQDYAGLWDFMDSGSREKIAKQLRGLQEIKEGDSLFEPTWRLYREKFDLRREDVRGLDARQYFLAILNGIDRAQPELRRQQIEETRGSEIVSIRIEGATAETKTRATSGAEETSTWVKEGGAWRCKADVWE